VAYVAEIQLAVKGARQLNELSDAIKDTSNRVDRLNRDIKTLSEGGIPRTINNLTNIVQQAAAAFNAAALETDEAATAARKYVQATDALNAGLRERISLLAKIRAEERITKPGDAGTGQQTPALPPQLIRTYKIGKNWVKFFQDAAEVAVDLRARSLNTQKNWNDFFATATQAAVNVKANSLNTRKNWNDFFATAAQAAVNVKANSLNTRKNWNDFFATAAQAAVNVKANSLNTKASWNTFFAEAAQLADDLTARTRQRELQISKQGALLRGDFSPIDGSPVTPGGRPIKGSPAFIKQQQERRRQQASGVALGAGFPLLFGGGAGSVIGGALGGLVPGPEGFAAQIALSALGQQLDTFATSLNGLADSLGNPTAALQAFETAGIKVDEAVKVQVENLVKQGEAYKAQQLIFEELTKALGPDAVQQLNAYDKELKNLEDAYKDLSDALIKELLPALTGVLSFIDDFAGRIKKMSETRIFKVLEKAAGFIPSFALSKAQFGAATARGKELAAKQPGTRDLDAETKAEMAEIRRKDLLERIKELQKEELSIIKAKAMSEQGLVDATARRMEMQSSVASAANAAFLQVNDLEMQRARNAGDTEKQYKLQLQRAQLIYTQTVLQVQQEQHKAALAVLSSQIKLKELQATVAQKAAKGEALAEDYAAIELQKQAVQLAYEGVNAAKLIAQYNLMGANALSQMNVEQAAFNRTQAAGRARGGGGAIGGGGGTGTRVTSMGTTRSLGAATPQQLAIQLSAKGLSGDFTEQQAITTLDGLYEQRVQKYIDDRAAQGFGNISPNSVSDRQLERAGFAEGGFVTRPTDAMVGEGGQPEYVIPASKMNDAVRRYSAGTRGEAVVSGAMSSGGANSTANYSNQQNAYYGGGTGASVNITTGPVIRMNNRDYVTMTDMQRGMAAAVGASQASMMRSMSRSYATRRSMGL
jgi:hypothetical protein